MRTRLSKKGGREGPRRSRLRAQSLEGEDHDYAIRIEVTHDHAPREWQFRKARKNQKGGVLINLAPSGRVEIREGLVRPKIEKETARPLAETPIVPAKAKAAYSKSLCGYIAHHKTAAVAEILFASPRAAQEVMIVHMLKGFCPHESFKVLGKEAEPQNAYKVLEAKAWFFVGVLGFTVEEGESLWDSFPPGFVSELKLYEAVRRLSDYDLGQLQILLTALSFGQECCEALDSSDSLFNRVARDLSVDMRRHWQPDAAFFSKRNRDQLVEIAIECGYAEGKGQVSGYKKTDLVNALARFFQTAKAAAEPTPQQVKARDWLPEAMLFPAVDRDAPAEVAEETDSDDEITGDE
jgi:ParB family transcriptional regulator, chromosome partitioning protein